MSQDESRRQGNPNAKKKEFRRMRIISERQESEWK